MFKRKHFVQEQRRYIRLDSVSPVEFRIMGIDGKECFSDWLQGFTRNIGKGGICLEINNLKLEFGALLINRQVKLSLKIDLPVFQSPVNAVADVAWAKNNSDTLNKYTVGLVYESINPRQNNKIMLYARAKKIFVPIALSGVFIMGTGLMAGAYINNKLVYNNRVIVKQLVGAIQEANIVKEKINLINEEKNKSEQKIKELIAGIESFEKEKVLLREKAKLDGLTAAEKIEGLNSRIEKLSLEKADLEDKLTALKRQESAVSVELSRIDKIKTGLEKANLDRMFKWLKVHQNPLTGLVMSFEGDNAIANWAFIYDQSLSAQVYTLFSDYGRAGKILDFFSRKAKKSGENLFHNAYYVNDGSPAEYTVHCGPNIWLGISALQYINKSGSKEYLGLAEGIAQAIIGLQNEDKDGGIKGGPGITWYSTEHNLDAYAFFDMLYRVTGKKQYQLARDGVLNWIILHTYDKMDIPIKRGKGDSTIATDTYAWSIAAIGPERLTQLGMDPDRILKFAEENCAVTVNYKRPDGDNIKITGFDFAPQRHVSRGGLVSSEWTAQMVMSFKIMAEYYRQKGAKPQADYYEAKVQNYLSALGCMIISSPSPSGQGDSCLPYATQENADTGHGWMTPKGVSTGSVAGTAYTLLAYYGFNPLEFNLSAENRGLLPVNERPADSGASLKPLSREGSANEQ